MSKIKKIIVIIFTIVLATAIVGLAGFYMQFTIVGSIFGEHEIYSVNVTEVNLSGSDIESFDSVKRLKKIESIDLTNTSFNDLSLLYDCDSIKNVYLYDKAMDAYELYAFYEKQPNARVWCDIDFSGKKYTVSSTDAKFSNLTEYELDFLSVLKNLKRLDITECEVSPEKCIFLSSMLPECEIKCRISLNGQEYENDVESINLGSDFSEKEIKAIACFNNLKRIVIAGIIDQELIAKIKEAYPEMEYISHMTLFGKELETSIEFIDLRGNQYTLDDVKSELDAKLSYFSNLKKIDMCGCGLSNAQMEELGNTYPNIKFVWIVKFKRWRVRTDAVIFSALNSNLPEYKVNDQKAYAPLFKYCPDLVAVDLGHSIITDISAMANLTKLRAVILTDNKFHDISAFANTPDLEFMELNVNRVNSVEPLRDLKNLKYINLYSSSGIKDLSPLYNHESLELVIFHRTITEDQRTQFRESNPNCKTFFSVDINKNLSTNKEWRENPYRIKLKNAFKNWKKVVGFNEETGEYIFDNNTDQYDYM